MLGQDDNFDMISLSILNTSIYIIYIYIYIGNLVLTTGLKT